MIDWGCFPIRDDLVIEGFHEYEGFYENLGMDAKCVV